MYLRLKSKHFKIDQACAGVGPVRLRACLQTKRPRSPLPLPRNTPSQIISKYTLFPHMLYFLF